MDAPRNLNGREGVEQGTNREATLRSGAPGPWLEQDAGGGKGVLPSEVAALLGAEEAHTPFGPCLEVRASYRIEYRHGLHRLCEFLSLDLRKLDRICGGAGQVQVSPEEVLFLDLETTGLSLGVGTWVFLVGLGFFEKGKYHTRQLFLRNFAEERALLYRASRMMERFRSVVTFNGKRFDLPLLEARLSLLGQEDCTSSLTHWDLLYPAKRLWKGRLEDCRLDTVEGARLGVCREERDIRGDRIPEGYLRFIHFGDASFLRRIVHHNASDLLTLLVLAVHVHKCCEDLDPRETNLVSLGRYLERTGSHEEGVKCYRIASQWGLGQHERERALFLLAQRMKREGKAEEALAAWEILAQEGIAWGAAACEELAKHHEHQSKDLSKAVYYVEKALGGDIFLEVPMRLKLEKRLTRLRKKVGKIPCK